MTKINTRTVVSPAYARDYKLACDARDAFLSGTDFKMETLGHRGTYCSIRDFEPGTEVEVRYHSLRGLVVVKVPELKIDLSELDHLALLDYASRLAKKLANNLCPSCNEKNKHQVKARESKTRAELARVEHHAKSVGCQLWCDCDS